MLILIIIIKDNKISRLINQGIKLYDILLLLCSFLCSIRHEKVLGLCDKILDYFQNNSL